MLKIPQSAIRVKRHTTQIPSICRAIRAVKSYMLHNFGLRQGGCDFAGGVFSDNLNDSVHPRHSEPVSQHWRGNPSLSVQTVYFVCVKEMRIATPVTSVTGSQ